MIAGQISALITNIESDYVSAFAGNADASLAQQLQSSKSKLISALHALLGAVRQGRRQELRRYADMQLPIDGAALFSSNCDDSVFFVCTI